MTNKNQDWLGNTKSVFSSLGARVDALSEREPTDFYATDPQALEIFLEILKQDGIILPHKICEPACGMGHLSKVLKITVMKWIHMIYIIMVMEKQVWIFLKVT